MGAARGLQKECFAGTRQPVHQMDTQAFPAVRRFFSHEREYAARDPRGVDEERDPETVESMRREEALMYVVQPQVLLRHAARVRGRAPASLALSIVAPCTTGRVTRGGARCSVTVSCPRVLRWGAVTETSGNPVS